MLVTTDTYTINLMHKIIRGFGRLPWMKWFLKAPSPQWLVFTFDLLAVIISACLVMWLGNLANGGIEIWRLLLATGVAFVVYAAVMLLVKPYRSIVRLSTFEDCFRVFLTTLISSAFLALVEIASYTIFHYSILGAWNIVVISVFAFAIMVCVRLVIKYFYRLITAESHRKRVVVLGSGINSFALAQALSYEIGGQFDPVLMLSLTGNEDGSVNGVPIRAYHPDTVKQVFAEFDADTLLFLSTHIDFIRNGAADIFLANNIKMMMLNQVEEFDVNESRGPKLSPHVQDIRIEDLLGRNPIETHNPAISNMLCGGTVLITGAAGSIGSEIVRQIALMNPGQIILVDQAETPMHEIQLEMAAQFPQTSIKLCIADIVNKDRMRDIFHRYQPRFVYHCAAYKHVPMMEKNPTEAVLTNVFGTKNIADLSVENNVERFVMVSTDKAVNPTNIMGASKRIAEIYVQSLAMTFANSTKPHTRFITTRFGNVLGSNGSVIPLFRKQIASGGPVTVTHRNIIRYFMTIPEACSLVLEAGCMGSGGEIFIFDMGKPIKIYDLAHRMISLAGLRPGVDVEIVETGLRPGEKLFEELLNDKEQTIATHHQKIMIAKVRVYDYTEVCERLDTLKDILHTNNVHDVVAQMKRIVPEYVSQNSTFESIDSEISPSEVIHELSDDK